MVSWLIPVVSLLIVLQTGGGLCGAFSLTSLFFFLFALQTIHKIQHFFRVAHNRGWQ